MELFSKKIKPEEIMDRIYKKRTIPRIGMMLLGILCIALAFNLFFRPFHIVTGGANGLSLVVANFVDINLAAFILIINIIMLYICLIVLGPKATIKALGVSLLTPLFIYLTSDINSLIYLKNVQPLLACIYGAVITGFGIGLIYRAGYLLGGLDVIKNILLKKSKIPIGRSTIFIDGAVVILGAFAFGWTIVMYSVVAIYIIGIMIDRVLFGQSNNKAFYVISSQDKAIKDYAKQTLDLEATVMKVKGSIRNSEHRMLMFVVPTKDYYLFREGIREIDDRAFFYIVDVYQTYEGQTKKPKQDKFIRI